jgi:hypothetical protein
MGPRIKKDRKHMEIYKDEMIVMGKPVIFDVVKINNKDFILTGKFIRTARMKQEWFDDVEQPDQIVQSLKKVVPRPDLFTFIQRPPDTIPKYLYYMEWQKITALSIRTLDDWWAKQISSETRKKAKRAEKRGVEIKIVEFNDELISGILSIFNEQPLRQGVPFWHYGKDFVTVKKEMSLDLQRSDFIGAYHQGELIGIVKLLYNTKIAEPVIIVSKAAYRDKYVNNALIAKAVAMCAMKGIPCLTYGPYWRQGNMADWLRRNGFERKQIPRYYIPLSIKGKCILKARLHRSIKDVLPEKLIVRLRNARSKWYLRKYGDVERA